MPIPIDQPCPCLAEHSPIDSGAPVCSAVVAQSFILFTNHSMALYNTKLNEHGSHAPNWLNWPVANPAMLDNL